MNHYNADMADTDTDCCYAQLQIMFLCRSNAYILQLCTYYLFNHAREKCLHVVMLAFTLPILY